jgi:membrane protein implicated in regulation of membrane protease activity
MAQFRQIRFGTAPLGWRGWVGLALAATLALGLVAAFVVVSLGVAIIALPVVAVAMAVARWRWRKLMQDQESGRDASPSATRAAPLIEGEYVVIESRPADRPGA